MGEVKYYIELFKEDKAVKIFLLGLILSLLALANLPKLISLDEFFGFFLAPSLLWGIGIFLAFVGYDILGYKWTLRHGYTVTNEASHQPGFRKGVAAYRIIQHGIFVPIMFLGVQQLGYVALSPIILWWMGGADILYYFGIDEPLPNEWEWLTNWVWIFPGGPIWKLIGKPLPNWAVITNATLGVILWSVFLLLF